MSSKSNSTPATHFLTKAKINFVIHTYDYKNDHETTIGLYAANAIHQPPHRVLKTLMAKVDEKNVCVVVPSNTTVSMKKLAAFLKAKSAHMLSSIDAERITGYHVGGISPFGQRKKSLTIFAEQIFQEKTVFINAGKHGFLAELDPNQACNALEAKSGNITHES